MSVDYMINIVEVNESQSILEITLDSDFISAPLTKYPLNITIYASSATQNDEITFVKKAEESNNQKENIIYEQSSKNVDISSTRSVATIASAMSTYGSAYVTCTYNYTSSSKFADRTVQINGFVDNKDNVGLYVGHECYNNIHYESIIFMKYGTQGVVNDFLNTMSRDGVGIDSLDSAYLQLYVGYNPNGSAGAVDLKRVNRSWTEATVDASYINSVDENYSGNIYNKSIPYQYYYTSFNITTMMKDNMRYLINGHGVSNEGFQIRASNSNVNRFNITSKDSPNASETPRLVMTYTKYTGVRIKADPAYIKLDYGKGTSISGNIKLYNARGVLESTVVM
jgi:hypothetical protein